MSSSKQVVLSIVVPPRILDKMRPEPRELAAGPVAFVQEVEVRALGQTIALPYRAHLYRCPAGHETVYYFHCDETVSVQPCVECGADAEDLTSAWRWGYHSDYTECVGCGAGFDFQKQRKTCRKTCPYEKINYRRSEEDD